MKLGDCLGSIMMIMTGSHTYSNDIRKALIKNEGDSGEYVKLSNNLLFRDLYPFTRCFLEESARPPRCACSACLFCNQVVAYSYRVAILSVNCLGYCERGDRVCRTLHVL